METGKTPNLPEESLEKVALVERLLEKAKETDRNKFRLVVGHVQYKGKEVKCEISSRLSMEEDDEESSAMDYMINLFTKGQSSNYQYSFHDDGSSLYREGSPYAGEIPEDFDKTFEILSTFQSDSERDISKLKASTASQVDAVNDGIS